MEHELWKAIVARLVALGKRLGQPRQRFSDLVVLQVWLWAVIHDRPVSWACQPQNWPPHLRRWAKPSSTTMSRRLRSPAVVELLQRLEDDVLRSGDAGTLVWLMDGKPLAISGISKDRQAGYGRAARGKAKGYKLHAVVSATGQVAEWRIAPMNKDERVMGRRMLRSAQLQGYVVADANYDSNPLHGVCDQRGNCQLVTPRRYGPGRGTGHRRQTAGRLRSIALLEEPFDQFGHWWRVSDLA